MMDVEASEDKMRDVMGFLPRSRIVMEGKVKRYHWRKRLVPDGLVQSRINHYLP